MAKMIRKKKRRLSFVSKCGIVMTISLVSWLFTSLFIGSLNTTLTIDIQNMNNELAAVKTENQQLNISIQALQNKDRVYTIAKDAGLNQNQDNVVSVGLGGVSEAE